MDEPSESDNGEDEVDEANVDDGGEYDTTYNGSCSPADKAKVNMILARAVKTMFTKKGERENLKAVVLDHVEANSTRALMSVNMLPTNIVVPNPCAGVRGALQSKIPGLNLFDGTIGELLMMNPTKQFDVVFADYTGVLLGSQCNETHDNPLHTVTTLLKDGRLPSRCVLAVEVCLRGSPAIYRRGGGGLHDTVHKENTVAIISQIKTNHFKILKKWEGRYGNMSWWIFGLEKR